MSLKKKILLYNINKNMLSIKTIAIISVLFVIYYYFNQTQVENFTTRAVNSMRSTSRVSSIRVDKDCEMSDWSTCDTNGKRHRDIISNYTGFGKKCEPLVKDCIVTKSGYRLPGGGYLSGNRNDEIEPYPIRVNSNECRERCDSNPNCLQFVSDNKACFMMKNKYSYNDSNKVGAPWVSGQRE